MLQYVTVAFPSHTHLLLGSITCHKLEYQLVILAGEGSVKCDTKIKLLTPSYDKVWDLVVTGPMGLSVQMSQEINTLWLYLTI